MSGRRHVKHASREAIAVAQGRTATHSHLRRRLLTIFLLTAISAALCTLIVYLTERHAHGGEILDLAAADGLIYAIFVVASVAGSFGAFFHQRSKEMDRLHHELATEARELRKHL